MPSLFVFSVLGCYLSRCSAFLRLCRVPFWGTEVALILLGFLGGFPMGAIIATQLYENGAVSRRQGEYLCTFSNLPSLSFILSYVGGVFGSPRWGAYLAALMLATAALSAVILKPLMLSKNERRILPSLSLPSGSIGELIKSSSINTLVVCGCVVFFGSLSAVFPKELCGALELSAGIAHCDSLSMAAFLLGFSGFSVMMQISATCKGLISPWPTMTAKALQGAFMGLFTFFLIDG